jgi:hypothetical protein
MLEDAPRTAPDELSLLANEPVGRDGGSYRVTTSRQGRSEAGHRVAKATCTHKRRKLGGGKEDLHLQAAVGICIDTTANRGGCRDTEVHHALRGDFLPASQPSKNFAIVHFEGYSPLRLGAPSLSDRDPDANPEGKPESLLGNNNH